MAQTVWNYYHKYTITNYIKDYDFVYFDADLDPEKEKIRKDEICKLFEDLPIKLDIVNQAGVHLWYENYFGYPIKQYQSIENAISTWPTTATSVAITLDQQKNIKICAPYGIDDLLNMIVRPNKIQITSEIYAQKLERWTQIWPKLTIIPW